MVAGRSSVGGSSAVAGRSSVGGSSAVAGRSSVGGSSAVAGSSAVGGKTGTGGVTGQPFRRHVGHVVQGANFLSYLPLVGLGSLLAAILLTSPKKLTS